MTKTAYYETFKKAYINYIKFVSSEEERFSNLDAEKIFKKYVGGMKKFFAKDNTNWEWDIDMIHAATQREVEESAQNIAYEDAETEMSVA